MLDNMKQSVMHMMIAVSKIGKPDRNFSFAYIKSLFKDAYFTAKQNRQPKDNNIDMMEDIHFFGMVAGFELGLQVGLDEKNKEKRLEELKQKLASAMPDGEKNAKK